MSTQEQARELLAHQRQQTEHLDKNMLSRASATVESETLDSTEEKARELVVQERQHEEEIQEKMLNRSVEELQE